MYTAVLVFAYHSLVVFVLHLVHVYCSHWSYVYYSIDLYILQFGYVFTVFFFYMSTTVGGPVSTVVWAFVYYTFCFVSTAFFFVYAYCGRQSYLLQF